MLRDNTKTKELVNECGKEIDEIIDLLRNFQGVSEFVDQDFQFELTATKGGLRRLKQNLKNDYDYLGHKEDLTLIALEAYTNHKASWERAGEISGLGIFGLENYCREKGVDNSKLRIDKYYNFTGPEAEKQIEEQWDKLMADK